MIASIGFLASKPSFIWSANEDGLAVRFSSLRSYEKSKNNSSSNTTEHLGFIRMQMLAESGQAEVREVEGGIFIAAEDVVRLDGETREAFELPPFWPGGFRLQTGGVPQEKRFSARLGLVNSIGSVLWNWALRGPILEVRGENYLPSSSQFAALSAYCVWQQTKPQDELANLSLLANLREAWKGGCHIDLEAYRETIIAHACELSIDTREEVETGDLILRPVVAGDFSKLDADQIELRLAQLQVGKERVVLRVGKTIVLLDKAQTEQARAIATRGRVPKKERVAFEKNPSAWLAENVFPDIELEFSPRVTGVGAWKSGYLGAGQENEQDWFGKQPQPEEKKAQNAAKIETGDDIIPVPEDEPVDEPVGPLVPLIIPNDFELGFGLSSGAPITSENEASYIPDFTCYARQPYPHQDKAIRWLLGHAQRALARQNANTPAQGFGAGALFADDMGLGKTLCSLIFIAEWLKILRKTTSIEPPAVLIVAPLSLLENWIDEIRNTYQDDQHVFSRILIAQSEGDLRKVRRNSNSKDVAVPGEVKEYGLVFGDGSERSLDCPGSCVLTTYQTLREYRFSFAKAEWSVAIFDEAQNIKNPNALQTISAKALKAFLRFTLTGTPVENHLGDFWSIIDTAEPGPLGSFAEFKRDWILRMLRERDQMAAIGKELRDHIGGLMLRRLKEDELEGLPKKTGMFDPIPVDLTPEQTMLYDTVLAAANAPVENLDPASNQQSQNRYLAALWQLRQIVLHPDLLGGGNIRPANNSSTARAVLCRSGKLAWLLQQLDDIKKKPEKVLVFCVQKKLQLALAHNLGQIYGLSVPVINGDTKTTSKRNPETTRLGLIKQFSEPGFGICILSPIAAGTGLNIVAANHVIHLERHWNPAKEDQATDRVYRIGQKLPVKVYLPTSKHPHVSSFDSVLHLLLEKKRKLQGAIGLVPPETASAPEIIQEIFGQSPSGTNPTIKLDLEYALKLSGALFESLIATIYKKNAQRLILTLRSFDHGCDVVVLGWGVKRENLLIQCKATSRDELNSEVAIREIEGARPYYENALGVTFQKRVLHTTAKKCSRRTKGAAELCKVNINGRDWLKAELTNNQIMLADVLATDAERERI